MEDQSALEALLELRPALLATPTAASAKVDALLSKLVCQSERLLFEEADGGPEVLELLEALLRAFEACAGRHPLHTRQLALCGAANKLLVVVAHAEGVEPQEQERLLRAVQTIRKKLACRRGPAKPVVCLSLLGTHLTQLEAGVVTLHIRGKGWRAVKSGVRVTMGAVKSVVMMRLDDDLLKGTKELLAAGSNAARRQLAEPAFTELLFVDQVRASRKRPPDGAGGLSHTELFALRDRHFVKYASGRWELKASVVWSVAEVLADPRATASLLRRWPCCSAPRVYHAPAAHTR